MIQNNSYDADTLHEECGVFGMYDFDGADVASTIMDCLPCSTVARRAAVLQSAIPAVLRARFFPTREWDL